MHDLHSETRRTISQYVLQPLIDKTMVDRILDVVIKVVDEMVTSGDEVSCLCCFFFLQVFFLAWDV